MTGLEIFFWILAAIIFYAYLGYGALVIALSRLKDLLKGKTKTFPDVCEPQVTLLFAAFNEEAWLEKKIENSLNLDYPKDKLKIIVVDDGSTDGSAEIIRKYPSIIHLQNAGRQGKMAALNLAMKSVDTKIVVFSDANTMLNREAIRELVGFFRDPAVGCVCGEKRVCTGDQNEAAGAGEGTYWRYESRIKAGEAGAGSCIGATGELYAIRAGLYRDQPKDTLLDDFAISLGIALRGYRIQYAPAAFATETASAGLDEEFKRKTRIAAGHLQSILRMPGLLNPLRHGMLALQYISHKFLRSFIAPLCFAALIPLNLFLLTQRWPLYAVLFILQILFYLAAGAGYLLQKRRLSSWLFFVPLYMTVMNVAAGAGFIRYFRGRQSVLWEKSARRIETIETEDDRK